MRYREATPDDALSIAALHSESWRSAYRGILRDAFLDGPVFEYHRTMWTERATAPRPDQWVLLAEDDSGLQGFVCLFGEDHPKWGAYVDNLHVKPVSKGQGTGAVLLRRAAARTAALYPNAGIYLWVYEENHPARGFYHYLGARNAERHVSEPPGGGEAAALRYIWPDPIPLASGRQPSQTSS